MILPSALKGRFTKIVNSGNVPNLLLHSISPGTGKTTLAKAICMDCGIDYQYINTSLRRGIDTLRDDISSYATCLAIDGGLKVVILDEFDGANDILQKALRASIEEYHEICRFILTANNNAVIHPAIKDRCEMVDFNFQDDAVSSEMKPKIFKRLCGILKSENIDYDAGVIAKLVENHYPSMRSMIKVLGQFSETFGAITSDILRYKDLDDELYDLILAKKVTAVRNMVLDRGYDHDSLYRGMFDSLIPRLTSKSKQAQAILIIEEYMDHSVKSIDKEITFTACILRLIETGVLNQQ